MGILPFSAQMMAGAGSELCQVTCNGQIFEGWTDVSVKRSIQDAAAVFQLTVTEASDASGAIMGWQIRPGDPIQIRLGGVQVIDGYVDVRQASYDAQSHGVEIAGRSRTADAVEAAAVTQAGRPAGPFAGYALDEIARALLDPLSIGLSVLGDIGAAFPMVTVQVGESVFEVIERLARLRGFRVTDDAHGNLVLADQKPATDDAPGLVEGVNILRANATMDVSALSSELYVYGQATGSDEATGADVSGQSAQASNDQMPRPRPKVIVLEQPGGKEDMKSRADREIAQQAAEQARIQIMVQGWQTASGDLWAPGGAVKVTSPMLLIDRVMAIAAVEFTQNDQDGTMTTLDLITPEALETMAPGADAPAPDSEDGDGDDEYETSAVDWNVRPAGGAA